MHSVVVVLLETKEKMSGQELVLADADTAFVSGIENLDGAVTILTHTNNSLSAREAENIIKRFSPFILQSYQDFTKALQVWEGENSKMSGRIESTVQEIGRVKNEYSKERRNAEELKEKVRSLGDEIANKERELNDARNSLTRANETHRDAERKLKDKKRDQKIVTGVGIGLAVFGGIGGLVAGSAMVGTGLTVLEEAVKESKRNVASARENVEQCEKSISTKRSEEDALHYQQSTKIKQMRVLEEKLEKLNESKRNLQVEQKKSVELAEKLKNTCHVMTTLWGKSKVLQKETEFCSYTLEPLFTPLKEIAEMFTFSEQSKLKMKTLLSKSIDYSALSVRMKAICSSAQDKRLSILDNYI